MQTLHIGPPLESLCNLLPVLAAINPDCLLEFLVLFLCPVSLDFASKTIGILRLLILGRSSLVKLWVVLLVADEMSLRLAIPQIIDVLRESVSLINSSKSTSIITSRVHQRVLLQRRTSQQESIRCRWLRQHGLSSLEVCGGQTILLHVEWR